MLYSKAYNIMPSTPIQFAPGISDALGSILARMSCHRVFAVVDKTVLETGVIDNALNTLTAAGLTYELFTDVAPNAPVSTVNHAVDILKAGDFDTILGIGGGSAMDIAKAARLFEAIPDAFTKCDLSHKGQYFPRQSSYKLVTLPTLSGSGCEYMGGAVITNDKTHVKVTLAAGDLAADMAIIDPLLQKNVPTFTAAASAIDALCHAFNKICAPGCEYQYRDVLSIDAIKAIWNALPILVHENTGDIEARSAICYGAIMSGYISGGPNGNFNHPVAHTISHFFPSVPHGIACAWALPITIRHILPACSEFAKKELAGIVGVDPNEDKLVEKITDSFITWLKSVGISSPANWVEPIKESDWVSIAPYVKEDGTWGLNPHYDYPDDATLETYLLEAYHDFD